MISLVFFVIQAYKKLIIKVKLGLLLSVPRKHKRLRDVQQRAKENKFLQVIASFK